MSQLIKMSGFPGSPGFIVHPWEVTLVRWSVPADKEFGLTVPEVFDK